MDTERPWNALPTVPLVNIFCRTSMKDRGCNLPPVCKSWADASRDSRCRASMVADPHYSAVDDAFIKSSSKRSVDDFNGRLAADGNRGITSLQTIIERANVDGFGITSLFLFPFITPHSSTHFDNVLLDLTASCPNLKHLSFDGSYWASKEAVLEVIRRCEKLELIDFADSPYFVPSLLREMSRCCPNLRGIRRNGSVERTAACALATLFPGLRLLNLSNSPIPKEDLSAILSGCPKLEYLNIIGCTEFLCATQIILRAAKQVAEFFYDCDKCYFDLNDYHYDDRDDGADCDLDLDGLDLNDYAYDAPDAKHAFWKKEDERESEERYTSLKDGGFDQYW